MARPVSHKCEFCGLFYDESLYTICPHCNKEPKIEEEKPILPSGDFDINAEPLMEDDFKTVQEKDLDEEDETPPMGLPDEYNMVKPVIPDGPGVVRPQPHPELQVINNSDDEMRTVMQFGIGRQPVVGWLICVKGECQGRAFEICSGNNTLGRDRDNDIVINDSTVSREQAIITFEPRKQDFSLKPKDNSQLMYTNDGMIAAGIRLTPYMHIEIGEKTEFIFVPFCGENFNWKEYIEE